MKRVVMAFLAGCAVVSAAPEEYAPVLPAARPLPLRSLASTNDWWRHATDTNDFEATSQYIIPDGSLTVELSVKCFGGKWQLGIRSATIAYEPVTYADYHGPGGGSIVEAFAGDLNDDGHSDVILVQCNGGACGLAAYRTDNLLLLSDGGGGFRLWEFETYGISTNDFTALTPHGSPAVLISQHLMADAHDGKTHSYWVFAPYQIQGNGLATLNSNEWPMWIWYTIKPNHKPTRHFSREEENLMWEQYLKEHQLVQEIALKRMDGTTSGSTVRATARP